MNSKTENLDNLDIPSATSMAPKMAPKYNVLAPGPVNLHPRVQLTLALPMIHHRTPEFEKIFARIKNQLKEVFQTKQDVFIHTSTGTGGMESLLVNTLSPGDKVLAIVSGKFGERWAQMAKTFGAQLTQLDVPWGEAVDPETVRTFLKRNPDTRLVLTQACETSTAVLHPIRELGLVVKEFANTLLLVDGITALGAMPMPMDEWHIDGLVGGSQKAFMLPTGLALVSFSAKAWSVIEQATCPRFYFDIRLEKKANQSGETHFSSPVTLMRPLEVVLQMVLEKGLPQHYHEISQRAFITHKWANGMGLKLFSKAPSASVTAIEVPPEVDGQKLRLLLEQKHRITIMGGQDQLKGKIIRIGHMGHIPPSDLTHLFEALTQTFLDMSPSSFRTMDTSKNLKDTQQWITANLSL